MADDEKASQSCCQWSLWFPVFIIAISVFPLLFVVVSVPFIQSIYLISAPITVDNVNGSVLLGTFGYCLNVTTNGTTNGPSNNGTNPAHATCSTPSFLYTLNNTLVAQVPMSQVITRVLALHYVAFFLAIIACLFSYWTLYCTRCFARVVAGFAGLIAFIAFSLDIAFALKQGRGIQSVGVAVYLTIFAAIPLFLFVIFCGVKAEEEPEAPQEEPYVDPLQLVMQHLALQAAAAPPPPPESPKPRWC